MRRWVDLELWVRWFVGGVEVERQKKWVGLMVDEDG